MSEQEHTPGPWAVFNDHPDEVTAKSLSYIRPVTTEGFYSKEIASLYGCTDREQCANARLIAAAPEMYSLIEQIAEGRNVAMSDAAVIVRKVTGR